MRGSLNSSSESAGTLPLRTTFSLKGKNAFLLIIGLIYFTMMANGQGQNNPLPKDSLDNEFLISINWSKPAQSFTTKNIGFGLGAYHLFLSKHTLNLIVGIEYNRTSQFVKYIHAGHNYSKYNLTYIINSISIPVGLRINIGKKNKFFFETGGFADLTISSNENVGSCVGIYFGMGFKIPVSKFDLIIKPEAKAGLHDLNNYGVHTGYIRLSVGLRI